MTKRILFGSVMIVLLAGLFCWEFALEGSKYAAWPLAGVFSLLILAGFYELAGMLRKAKIDAMPFVGGICAIVTATVPLWSKLLSAAGRENIYMNVLAAVFIVVFFAQMFFYKTNSAIKRLAGTFMGVIYLGLMAGFILRIRSDFGCWALIGFLAVVKATDIGAYFTGTMIGKHKIIPWLSPGKSWEGLVGGIAASLAVSWAFDHFAGMPYNGLTQLLIFGVTMTIVGQFGDLCESLLKRDSGVKDSAVMIPEFGGVLDLVDSPLVAAPVAYMIFKIVA